MNDARSDTASKLRLLLIDASPLIEEYTAAACPACSDPCCRQKHGLYRDGDISYLRGLGISIPNRDEARALEGPCECMGPHGCIQPRWLRPFKCTWYFCDALLAALDDGPQKKARKLASLMQHMLMLYDALE